MRRIVVGTEVLLATIIVFGILTTTAFTPVEQSIPEETVGASVDALFTQTAEAQLALPATETIEAAFTTMQTATASVRPYDVTRLGLAEEIRLGFSLTIDSGAYLSPTDDTFLYFDGTELCIYNLNGEIQFCVPQPQELAIDTDGVAWSPNGRYVAFTNQFYRTFNDIDDPDIWVLDVQQQVLNNITNDGALVLFPDDPAIAIANRDISPQWLGERILFIRTEIEGESISSPQIMSVNADGSNLRQDGEISLENGLRINRFVLSENGSKIAYEAEQDLSLRVDDGLAGVWIADINGDNAQRLVSPSDSQPDSLMPLALSASGEYVAIFNGDGALFDSGVDLVQVYDVATGGRISLTGDIEGDNSLGVVTGVGFVPGRDAAVFAVYDPQSEQSTLNIRDLNTSTTQELHRDNDISVMGAFALSPFSWREDNTMIYASGLGIVILRFDEAQ